MFLLRSATTATTFYVDSVRGNDASVGTSPQQPWQSLQRVLKEPLLPSDSVLFRRNCVWRGGWISARDGVTYGAYGPESDPKPRLLGSVSASTASDWRVMNGGSIWEADIGQLWTAAGGSAPSDLRDVGNIILDDEAGVGRKRYTMDELMVQNDFFYNTSSQRLYFATAAGNPASVHRTMECALYLFTTSAPIVVQNASHVVIEDLDVRYTGGNALNAGAGGGFGVRDLIIRRCGFSWIGGGCLIPAPRWKRDPHECTRFGNGIEISSWTCPPQRQRKEMSNIEIYGNRFWEVYDAAISPQGKGCYAQRNISIHHNLIAHSEYCLEIWGQGRTNESSMDGVLFASNVCANSGGGWSHSARPDPSGRHICSYTNSVNVSRVLVRDNIFFQSVPYQAGYWMQDPWDRRPCAAGHCGWAGALHTDHNLWYQTDRSLGSLLVLGNVSFDAATFEKYVGLTGNGIGSIAGHDPLLAGQLPSSTGTRPGLTNRTDLRPSPRSPAIGTGIWAGLHTDFDGRPIPVTSPDIGAYQVE
jgi:hypothetical protein